MNKTDFIAHGIFKLYGCNCWSECPNIKSDDDLYLVSLNYRGLYEDDYCTFWYLNAVTGEMVSDSWTTAGACPHFNSYLRMMLPDAHKAGFVPDEVYNNFIESRWRYYLASVVKDLTKLPTFFSDFSSTRMIGCDLNIPVNVTGGRKYRGAATLLKFVKESDGPWMYSNRGYHLMAQILGEDNRIYLVRPSYIDATKTMAKVSEKLEAIIATNPEDSSTLTKIYPFTDVDTSTAVDVNEQKRLDKYNAFRQAKMPNLIAWCREKKPNESDEYIEQWAAQIFSRKYPMR